VGPAIPEEDEAMRLAYDKNSHGLFITFADRPSASSEDIAPGIVVDFDRDGKAVAIEVEDVRGIVDEKVLARLVEPKIRKGADLREFRERFGLTQQQLGDALDLPRNTIARWEREDMNMEKSRLLELALQSLIGLSGTEKGRGTGALNPTLTATASRSSRRMTMLRDAPTAKTIKRTDAASTPARSRRAAAKKR
jgi:transcriptional regulator with XRE-family HTH domain/uncharacterized protein YuzE